MSRFLPLVKIWVTDSCIFPFVLLSGTLIAQLSNNKRSSSKSNNRFHSRIQLLYNKNSVCWRKSQSTQFQALYAFVCRESGIKEHLSFDFSSAFPAYCALGMTHQSLLFIFYYLPVPSGKSLHGIHHLQCLFQVYI